MLQSLLRSFQLRVFKIQSLPFIQGIVEISAKHFIFILEGRRPIVTPGEQQGFP